MWILRRNRTSGLLCCLVSCVLILHWLRQFSNIFDLVYYFISQESVPLPLALQCNLGRLGNQMCTYASLYGISALNRRRRFVAFSCNVKHLKDIFVGPSEAVTKDQNVYIRWHPWSLRSYLMPGDADIPSNSNFLDGFQHVCSFTFFDHVKEEIRHEFRFKGHLKEYAQAVLHKASGQHWTNVTYIGVHVRRGDYNKHWLEAFDGVPVNMEFFKKAFQYFREKYQNVIFVCVSEDRVYCKRELSARFGVHVPEKAPSPAHDLAILANCNHTVMTYGTFGFWGAYLAGGEVVYFDKFLRPNTSFTREKFIFEKMYPPYWKSIVTVNASIWIQTTRAPRGLNVTVKS